MRGTKFSELGSGGRIVVSAILGFAIACIAMIVAFVGMLFGSAASMVFLLPMAPGLGIALLLGMHGKDVGGIFGPLWFNTGIYAVVVLAMWQRRVRRAQSGKRTEEIGTL